ncbi:Peptidase, M48 family [hydrothermal vent metagenome]|uniref:Peptidase, M48 family n=1 Tax=hydrothermal vent metagenome TaxID=652676 RepID=A0A3B1DT59_9ZZZZ
MDYLTIILTILIGYYFLDLVVDVLNIRNLSPHLPKEFEGYYDQDKYHKSQDYLKETTKFDVVKETLSLGLLIPFILFGGFNWIDQWARGFGQGSIITGLIFSGALMLASLILSLPFSIYSTFVIEEKFGFNKTTVKTFIGDLVKEIFLGVVLGGLLLSIVLWFFGKFDSSAWLYCWAAVTIFQLFLTLIAPVTILPLFNKFIPLEEGELKTKIEKYANQQKFQLSGIFKIDGSRRSTKSNAYFTGFGRWRRIALFDTLIEKHTTDELVSILAHEIGHCKKKHITSSMIWSIFNMGIMFYILSVFLNNEGLFAAFKMEQTSIYASLVFFGFLYTPISWILSIISNVMSRKHEYEADQFAVTTYHKPESMISALKQLSVDNLSNLTPHPLAVFLSYSHPTVLQRIKAIKNGIKD